MRFFLLASALSLIAGSAVASSVEPITTKKISAGSIVIKSCDDCPELKIIKSKRAYVVPALKEGTQVTEIRDVNGEKKVVRTEAWLGGSPVIFVSKAPAEAVTAAATAGQPAQAAEIELPATGVDATATTAAVGVAGAEEPAIAASTPTLDATDFNLRVE